MATAPLLFRTSTFTQVNVLESNIRRSNSSMLRRETELSSGFRVQRISDDPVSATRALDFKGQIDEGKGYLENISLARPELEAIENAMADASRILTRAREIYLTESSSSLAQTRDIAAGEIDQLLTEMVEVANRKFQGKYLFAGNDGSNPPVQMVNGFVDFVGSPSTTPVSISANVSIDRDVSVVDAFGGLSTQIYGGVDLDPRVTAATKLADLNGGDGVPAGSVLIRDGSGTEATVDLSAAETVGDVIALLDDSGLVTASINSAGDGIDLAFSGSSITVSEVNGGTVANALGIAGSAGSTPLSGSDLDPRLRLTTPLADLFDSSATPDLTSGITIANDLGTTAISFAGATTVEDVINLVNGSGAHVRASLNDDGDRIMIQSTLSGASFTVSENGGTTAADLGWLIDFADLELDHMNNGLGVTSVGGDDFAITLKDGTRLAIDISGASTIQDVLDAINGHPDNGGKLAAGVVTGQNRIELVDVTGGTGDLRVEPLNGSFAAQGLGIEKEVADPGDTLTGDDLSPAGFYVESIFSTLILLRDALLQDNDTKIEKAGKFFSSDEDRLLGATGEVGTRVSRMNLTEGRLRDQELQLKGLVSEDLEVDLASSVLEFEKQRNILEASLSVTARILSLTLLDFLG